MVVVCVCVCVCACVCVCVWGGGGGVIITTVFSVSKAIGMLSPLVQL